ncbi:hypothetical protein KFE25_014067 [Diacronema lutheri]|uniref:Uncharacterized protein n=1 Tax=Diacronema lutheri TaxID=2081491 RepID=A0A8J5X1D7_DIALT|nr:hypothetical protein KFE25_014067 [Diacronema lutheri]
MAPRQIVVLVVVLVASTTALQRPAPPPRARACGGAVAARRAFTAAAFLGTAIGPAVAQDRSIFDSTCLGFGCNNYNGQGFGGMAAPTDEATMPFAQFAAQLKDPEQRARVAKVDIYGAGGDKVYVSFADGTKARLGEGLPIDDSNGWSSPLWLVRILDNVNVPHAYHFRPGDNP